MSITKLILLSLVVIPLEFAQAKKVYQKPLLVKFEDGISDLLKMFEKGTSHVKEKSCWDESGNFLSDKCLKTSSEKIVAEREISNWPLVAVELLEPQNYRMLGGLSFHSSSNQDSNSFSKHHSDGKWKAKKKFPVGTDLTIFQYDSSTKSLNLFKRTRVPENGIVQLDKPRPITSELLLKIDKPGRELISVSFENAKIGTIFEKNGEFKIDLPEGKFNVELSYTKFPAKDEFHFTFPITSKGSEPVQVINVKLDAFQKKVETPKPRLVHDSGYLSWNPKEMTLELKSTGHYFSNIDNIEKFSIKETDKNILPLFELKGDKLKVKDEKAFRDLVKDLPSYTFSLSASYTNYARVYSVKDYIVRTSGDWLSATTGKLKVYDISGTSKMFFEANNSNDLIEIKSTLKKSPNVTAIIFQGLDEKNGLVNIGPGPWGQEGWVKATYWDPFVSGGVLFLDEVKNRESRFFKPEEVMDTDGNFKFKILDLKYFNELQKVSRVIDLTSSKLGLNIYENEMKIQLYESPDLNSPSRGEIHFRYENDILNSDYLMSEEKKTFVANIFQGRCSSETKPTALQLAYETYGDFTQIGPGPWGDYAWVNIKSINPDDASVPVSVPSEIRINSRSSVQCPKEEFKGSFEQDPLYINFDFTDYPDSRSSFKCDPYELTASNDSCHVYEEPCEGHWISNDFPGKLRKERSPLKIEIDKFPGKLILYEKLGTRTIEPYKSESQGAEHYFKDVTKPSDTYLISIRQADRGPIVKNPDGTIIDVVGDIQEVGYYKLTLDEKTDVIKVQYPKDFISVKFQLSDLEKYSANVYLDKNKIARFNEKNSQEVKMSAGVYHFEFHLKDENSPAKILKESFSINPKNGPRQVIKLSASNFVKESIYSSQMLHLNSQNGMLTILRQVEEDRSITSVLSLKFYSDNVKEIMNFASVEKGKLKITPNILSQVLDNKKDTSLKFKGTCRVAEVRTKNKLLSIHNQPSNDSEKLGTIIYPYSADSLQFQDKFGKTVSFLPNYFRGKCDSVGKFLSLHQVESAQNGWSNLGKGPWGNSGWVEIEAGPFFNSDFIFEINAANYRVLKDKKNKIIIQNDDSVEVDQKEVEREKILSPTGKFIPHLRCEIGC